METTFRTLIEELFSKHISLEKVNEIVNDVYKPKNEVVEPAKKVTEKNTNISRFSKATLNQLKAELIKVGITFTDDKEVEKFKKEFTKHANSMDKETYSSKKIEDHMKDFAETKKPITHSIPENINSNIYTTVQVTLDELQKNNHLIVVGSDGPQHKFWDSLVGKFVVGPDSDDEDNDITVKRNGKTYYVGKRSGRVYEKTDDDDEEDKFVGYAGVGKFKDIVTK